MPAGAASGGPVTGHLTTLQMQLVRRDPNTRALRAGDPPRKLITARPKSPRNPEPPIHSPRDTFAGSAAGPGGAAPAALWCVVLSAFAAWAPLDLRRLRAQLLVPDAAGVPSLRDRPG
jgi:hypothetical protein